MFAAVSVMCGDPKGFANRCSTNASYLPFYVVDEANNGNVVKNNAVHCGEWVKKLFVDLRRIQGANEWYSGEVEVIGDWFAHKRFHRQLGVPGRDEYKTNRETDNRFHWIGVSGIGDHFLNDWKNRIHAICPQRCKSTSLTETKQAAKTPAWLPVRTKGVVKVHAAFAGSRRFLQADSVPRQRHDGSPRTPRAADYRRCWTRSTRPAIGSTSSTPRWH
ncbi:MAG: hypothetical protein U0744_17255 [Gemmataceae bacterium]